MSHPKIYRVVNFLAGNLGEEKILDWNYFSILHFHFRFQSVSLKYLSFTLLKINILINLSITIMVAYLIFTHQPTN